MASTVQSTQAALQGWLGVPWIIWASVIGAGVASGVSWLTSRASAKNSLVLLVKQHEHDLAEALLQRKHDAEQKVEDRKGAIRREVYTQAVEQAHALLAAIGGLAYRSANTTNDSEPLQAFLKANGKVWLVAEAEAAHLSRDLASKFAELFLHAMVASMPARIAFEPVRRLDAEIKSKESESGRLHMQYNDARSKNASQRDCERLAELLKESRGRIDELQIERLRAHADAMPFLFRAFRESFGELRSLQRLLCKLVSSLRYELHLPRDDDEFLVQLNDMETRAWVAMNQIFGSDPAAPMPEIAEKPESVTTVEGR